MNSNSNLYQSMDSSQRTSDKRDKMIVCLYEAIGTCMLLLAINWGMDIHDSSRYSMEICTSITFFAAYIILAPVSGGHFNPAVTCAIFINLGRANYKSNVKFYSCIIGS